MDTRSVHPAGISIELASVSQSSNQPAQTETKASQRDLIKAVKALQSADLFGDDRELTFVLDRVTHRALVRIVDSRTREVILQVPAEQVLQMAKDMGSSM
jgi:uncharacterized FlaG/YvyC family protein